MYLRSDIVMRVLQESFSTDCQAYDQIKRNVRKTCAQKLAIFLKTGSW